jgi:hypothetical protein
MVALQDQARRPKQTERFAYADDRRRFGTVGNTIVEVLGEANEPMKLGAISTRLSRGSSVTPFQ